MSKIKNQCFSSFLLGGLFHKWAQHGRPRKRVIYFIGLECLKSNKMWCAKVDHQGWISILHAHSSNWHPTLSYRFVSSWCMGIMLINFNGVDFHLNGLILNLNGKVAKSIPSTHQHDFVIYIFALYLLNLQMYCLEAILHVENCDSTVNPYNLLLSTCFYKKKKNKHKVNAMFWPWM